MGPTRRSAERSGISQSFSVDGGTLLFTRRVPQLTVGDFLQVCQAAGPRGAVQAYQAMMGAPMRVGWRSGGSRGEQALQLELQPCHFGGVRRWFLCPNCQRRVYTLYFDRGFACRRCLRLRYISRTWSDSASLLGHYERMIELMEHRPGPKPARFYRYVEKADLYNARVARRLFRMIR